MTVISSCRSVWSLNQPEAAKFTRVGTYDPTGSVLCDPNPSPTCEGWIHEIHFGAAACWNVGTDRPSRPFDWSRNRAALHGPVSESPRVWFYRITQAPRMTNGEEVIRADAVSMQRLPR